MFPSVNARILYILWFSLTQQREKNQKWLHTSVWHSEAGSQTVMSRNTWHGWEISKQEIIIAHGEQPPGRWDSDVSSAEKPAARLNACHLGSVLHVFDSIWTVTGIHINYKLTCKAWQHLSTWHLPNHSLWAGVCGLCSWKDKAKTENRQDLLNGCLPVGAEMCWRSHTEYSGSLCVPFPHFSRPTCFKASFGFSCLL